MTNANLSLHHFPNLLKSSRSYGNSLLQYVRLSRLSGCLRSWKEHR